MTDDRGTMRGVTLVGSIEGIERLGIIPCDSEVVIESLYSPTGCDLGQAIDRIYEKTRTAPNWLRHPSGLREGGTVLLTDAGSEAANIRIARRLASELASFGKGSLVLALGEPAVPLLHCLNAGGTLPVYPLAPGAGPLGLALEQRIAARLCLPADQVTIPLLGDDARDARFLSRHARIAAIPLLEFLSTREMEEDLAALSEEVPPALFERYLVAACRAMLAPRSSVLSCLGFVEATDGVPAGFATLPFLLSPGVPPVPWIDLAGDGIAAPVAASTTRHLALLRQYGM